MVGTITKHSPGQESLLNIDCNGRYWHHLNQGPNFPGDIYDYHLRTYGPNVVYDDFIQNFTADAWDPKEWVDLFADAGANYFVQVTKHHDGYALFDVPETATKRTSVQLFPHRNLLQVGLGTQDGAFVGEESRFQMLMLLYLLGTLRCCKEIPTPSASRDLSLLARVVQPGLQTVRLCQLAWWYVQPTADLCQYYITYLTITFRKRL